MADHDPSAEGDAARLVEEVAARAEAAPAPASPTAGPRKSAEQMRAEMADARHRLETAWHTSDSGTEIPDSDRLRQVKRAVMIGLRPVTSHQIPFNREVVVAVDRLANVVEGVATQVEGAEERVDDRLKRVEAGIATVDVAGADAEAEVALLRATCDELTGRLEAAEAALVEQRQALAAARAREDLVLRAARDLAGDEGRTVLAQEADAADAALVRRLAAAGRPGPEALRAQARAVVDAVAEAAVAAPVLDLASAGGEWLDAWSARGIEATGVEPDADAAETLRARGHAVAPADPVAHLASRPAGSLGAVTAAVLADVVPLADLVTLVDAARQALRPGGVLVLAVADPAGQATGDGQWADPRRRPVHPHTLTLLALERGWVEADLAALDDEAGASHVLVARTAGAASAR